MIPLDPITTMQREDSQPAAGQWLPTCSNAGGPPADLACALGHR